MAWQRKIWLSYYLLTIRFYLVPLPRFERGACGLGIRRSILLSYRGEGAGLKEEFV